MLEVSFIEEISITLNIIVKYVPKEELIKIIDTILLSLDIRLDSWNSDYTQYTKSHLECTMEASKKTKIQQYWIPIIANWNMNYWSNVNEWAEDIDMWIKREELLKTES